MLCCAAAISLTTIAPSERATAQADQARATPLLGRLGPGSPAPPKPVRIARGTSPGGVRWTLDAAIHGRWLQLDTGLPAADGYGGSMTFPWRSRLRLGVGIGSGLGRADEWAIDGVAYRTVDRLRVTTAAGTTVTFRSRRAPRSAVRRHPQLDRYRYVMRFFPADQRPLGVTALGPRGTVVAEQSLTSADPTDGP